MVKNLQPVPRIRVRCVLLVALVIPALISGMSILEKIAACAFMTVLVGSYRQSQITEERFRTRLVVCFWPLPLKSCKLKRVVAVETKLEDRASWGTFFLFGLGQWLLSRIFDRLLPWLGGDYQIWLRQPKEKRLIAWQGCKEDDFHENLQLLKSAAPNAEVCRI